MTLLRILWRTLLPATPIARVTPAPRRERPWALDASSEEQSIDVVTRHITEAEQPWRTGDRTVSEFRVGNDCQQRRPLHDEHGDLAGPRLFGVVGRITL